jgi:hypothetical protein
MNDRVSSVVPQQSSTIISRIVGPQNALLTVLVLTGLEGVTKPALQLRQGK